MPSWSVCVFAHNEATLIEASLRSILRGLGDRRATVHVVVNGSRDGTAEVVETMLAREPRLRLHRLALGDKSNAWNHYVHTAGDADMHVFVDGDTEIDEAAFTAFEARARGRDGVLVLAGVSKGGSGDARVADMQMRCNALAGCLYAMPGEAIRMLRQRRFRLPIGLIGDDSLICWLAKLRWEPQTGRFDETALVQCPDANFRFGKTRYWRPDLAWEHVKRQKRYALRQLQLNALLPVLRREGVAGTPAHVMDLFSDPALMRVPRDRAFHPFYWWASWDLRRRVAAYGRRPRGRAQPESPAP